MASVSRLTGLVINRFTPIAFAPSAVILSLNPEHKMIREAVTGLFCRPEFYAFAAFYPWLSEADYQV